MTCHLVALDKAPGVFPEGIVDITRFLLFTCVLLITDATEKEACGNLNLCAGLGVYIQGYIKSNMAKYIKYQYLPATDQALLDGGASRKKGMRGDGKGEEGGSRKGGTQKKD